MGMEFVLCSYSAVPPCTGIAYCIGCPILSTNSDLFLTNRPSILPDQLKSVAVHDTKFVHLSGVTLPPRENTDKSFYLPAMMYHPENSPIKEVPIRSRPLVALLMDSQVVRQLPPAIEVNPSPNEKPADRKLQQVIAWVAKTNPIEVLQAVMETITNSTVSSSVATTIVDYLSRYAPDFADAYKIMSILNLRESIPEVLPVPESEKHNPLASSPEVFFQSAAEILKGDAQRYRRLDFFYKWPVALTYLFRFGKLDNEIVTALYTETGALMESPLIFLAKYPSTCGPSRILRFVQYCLVMGVEQANGQLSKLIGLRPQVREICYEGSFRYKAYHLDVSPLILPARCSADDFLTTYFGYQPSRDIPDWCNALIISCLIWHCQKLGTEEHKNCDIAECPTVLAVLVVAMATHYNSGKDEREVLKHYTDMSSFALKHINDSGIAALDAEKCIMHGALEVMGVYAQYISLYNLLTALQDPNKVPDFNSPEYNRFPPHHLAFPSFKLIVQVARHIKCQPTPSITASRLWLTKLFVPSGDPAVIEKLREFATLFPTVLSFIAGVSLKWRPPEVKVTDPPLCFIPKSERPQRTDKKPGGFQNRFSMPPGAGGVPRGFSNPRGNFFHNGGSNNNNMNQPGRRSFGGPGGFNNTQRPRFGNGDAPNNNGFQARGPNSSRGGGGANGGFRGGRGRGGGGGGNSYATRLANRMGQMNLNSSGGS